MSTRGNYVFIDYPYKKDENDKWVQAPEQIVELKKGISNDSELIKEGYNVYIHSDNYPSYTLPKLLEFLNYPASIARGNDPSYLSAWFVADRCVNDILKYRVAFSRDDVNILDDSYRNFLQGYEPKGSDIKEIDEYTGIGLLNGLAGWTDYTYVIVPDTHLEGSFIKVDGFRIFIFDYQFNFIDEIHSTDDLKELEQQEWWD